MISEFIWIDLIEQTNSSFHCFCSLPDPNLENEDEMVVCGDITCDCQITTKVVNVVIKLYTNFKELCIGDIYQRKDFVKTLFYIIKIKYGLCFDDVKIDLYDSWGEYSGSLDDIDEIVRET